MGSAHSQKWHVYNTHLNRFMVQWRLVAAPNKKTLTLLSASVLNGTGLTGMNVFYCFCSSGLFVRTPQWMHLLRGRPNPHYLSVSTAFRAIVPQWAHAASSKPKRWAVPGRLGSYDQRQVGGMQRHQLEFDIISSPAPFPLYTVWDSPAE